MAEKRTEEFKREAVRIALTSGLTRRRVAGDLGIGLSSLTKWIKAYGGQDRTAPGGDADLAREVDRLRRELRLVTEEREVV